MVELLNKGRALFVDFLALLKKIYKYFCMMTLDQRSIEVINKARFVLWLLLICLRSPSVGAFGSPLCRGFLVNNFVYCAVPGIDVKNSNLV